MQLNGPGLAATAILVAAFAVAGDLAAGAETGGPPSGDYELVWSDEFDGTQLDRTKWDYRQLGRRRQAINVKDTVALDGKGHLILTTRIVGKDIHTAMIGTQGKFETVFGYFECRVKMQKSHGHWSAFWLQSPTLGKTIGDVKASGTEIDIYECFLARENWVSSNLHWDGYGKHHKHVGSGRIKVPDLTKGYHTFGLEWTAEAYAFYVDGKKRWQSDKAVSHAKEYIILSLEVGPKQERIARRQAGFSDSVTFDYVRVYKRKPKGASARRRLAVTRIADTTVDPAALNFTAGYTGCLNGKAFQQDGVVSHNGWQYATYFDGRRRLCLGRRNLAGNTWEVIRFADYVQKANDRHNVAVVGVCPGDGTLHLAFDHHGSELHYRVSRKGAATDPAGVTWDASLFGTTTSELEAGKRLAGITYPRFVTTPGGGLQFWYRVGGSGNGDSHLAEYDPKRGTWRQVGLMIARTGRYGRSASRCAYLNRLDYDRHGRLHVTWCWRESPDVMTNHDLCHAVSDDQGRSWSNSAGAPIARPGKGGDPLDVNSKGVVFRALPTKRGLINATAQAVDSHGRPHVVTWHLPDGAEASASWKDARQRSRYFHYWLDGTGNWRRRGLGFVGGRPKLVLDKNDDAYLVFAGQRAFGDLRIAAASARSEYADWKVAHREAGRPAFTGEPLIDPHRWAREGILSVYIQERPRQRRLSSPLHVMDFRLGPP